MKPNKLLSIIYLPLIFLILFLIAHFIAQIVGMPEDEVIYGYIKNFFETYGLIVVFLAALIEAILLVGNYFPGSAVIFLGVIISIGNPIQAFLVVLLVILAFIISNILNYVLGRTAWYKVLAKFGMEKAIKDTKKRYLKHGPKALFLAYIMPSIGAVMSTSVGILKMDFKKFLFYSIIFITFWCTFWGILVYSLGEAALYLMSLKGILLIFVIWTIGTLIIHYFENKYLEKN